MFHDAEAETRSARFPRPVGTDPVKPLENAVLVVERDADPGVGDGEANAVCLHGRLRMINEVGFWRVVAKCEQCLRHEGQIFRFHGSQTLY